MDFIVSGPHVIPTKSVAKGVKHLDLSRDSVKAFWEKHEKITEMPIGAACGCYIYAVRAGKGITPWYVGQSKGRFDKEVFSLDKYKKYKEHFETVGKGTPVLFLIIRQVASERIANVKLSKVDADWIEDYFIRRALDKNPKLLNKMKTKHFTTVKVPGVHNATAKTDSDKKLAKTLGMSKPYGHAKAVGKFHQ